jgi:hypothetical protein
VIQNEEAVNENRLSTPGRRLFSLAYGGRCAGYVINACISRFAPGIATRSA